MRKRWQPPVPPAVYKFPVPVNALAFTPDGTRVVVGGQHELLVWNLKGPKLEQRIRTRSERTHALVFLPEGLLAVAAGRPGQEGDVKLYNLNAKPSKTENGVAYLDGVSDTAVMVKQLHEADDVVLCLALSADGKKLAAGGTDRISRVWNIPEGTLFQTAENNADWVMGLAFTPDGKLLLSAGRDRTAKAWDLAKKDSVQTFPDHQVAVYGVVARPDGTQAYSVGADRSVRAWKPGGDAKQIRSSAAHGDEVYKIAYSPKDNLFATAGADKSVRLWEPDRLTNSRTLTGMNDVVYALAFSPDGTNVAAGGYDGRVHVWTVKDGKPVVNFPAAPGAKD
jgi:WD40 repeat protein